MENVGKYVWRNVCVRHDEDGNPVFDRVKVPVLEPGQVPPEPSGIEELPPIENPGSPSNESTLRPPKDIGIPSWLKRDLKD
jgi:hypothetical protein